MTFEEKMQRLNELTAMLENSQCTLDESLAYYEEGVKLKEQIRENLLNSRAQRSVSKRYANARGQNFYR